MSTISVRLPDSLHETVRQLAQRDHVSINQFIALALTEKVSALLTDEYLKQRAARGSRENFDQVLNQIPDIEPEEFDRW
jgi:hypothetical protein